MNRNVLAAALVVGLLRGPGASQAIDCCQLTPPARQSDGGTITGGVFVDEVSYFGVSRTAPGGAPDPAFGVDGVTEPIEDLPSTRAAAVAVLADDRILAAGELVTPPFSGQHGFVVVRFNADGSLDEEFGEGGVAVSATFEGPAEFAAMALRPDGGVVVAASEEVAPDEPNYALAVFDADGNPDATFGDPLVEFGVLRDLDVQPDDKIVVALGGPAFFDSGRIARIDPDGTYDEDFGGGIIAPDLGPEDDVFHQIVLQPDGKLVVAGAAGVARGVLSDVLSDLAIFRLLPNGEFDEGFGEGGKRITTLGGRFEALRNVVLRCDGSLLASGHSVSPSDGEEAVGNILIRYTSSGDVDDSYGIGGVAACEFLGGACTDPNPCESTTTSVPAVTSTTSSSSATVSTSSTTSSTTDPVVTSTTTSSSATVVSTSSTTVPADTSTTTSSSSTVVPTSSTTSSTTDPAGSGSNDGCVAACDDGDACTADACESRECVASPVTGTAAVTCVCERNTLDACRQEGLPASIARHLDRACLALAKLPDATSTKSRKILGKALRHWGAIGRLVTRPKIVAKVSPSCSDALAAFQADAIARAQTLRDELIGGGAKRR